MEFPFRIVRIELDGSGCLLKGEICDSDIMFLDRSGKLVRVLPLENHPSALILAEPLSWHFECQAQIYTPGHLSPTHQNLYLWEDDIVTIEGEEGQWTLEFAAKTQAFEYLKRANISGGIYDSRPVAQIAPERVMVIGNRLLTPSGDTAYKPP